MKQGASLTSVISALDAGAMTRPVDWQDVMKQAFAYEDYYWCLHPVLRGDLKTPAEWEAHARKLARGVAHIYSYSDKDKTGLATLRPYAGILSSTPTGRELKHVIHGSLPRPGTLGCSLQISAKDPCNSHTHECVFFGPSKAELIRSITEWCSHYFTRTCQWYVYPLPWMKWTYYRYWPEERTHGEVIDRDGTAVIREQLPSILLEMTSKHNFNNHVEFSTVNTYNEPYTMRVYCAFVIMSKL